jgi:hypothetical protein
MFAERYDYAAVLPKDATIELKISDPLLLEWSAYYLRFHKTVAVVGQLIYFPSPSITNPAVQQRISAAQYLLTDKILAKTTSSGRTGFCMPTKSRRHLRRRNVG